MDETIIQEILTEVFSSLEPLDAQSAAILQYLKAKGLATDEELAPFLEQAKNTSSVRWLAARVRIASLLSSALKNPEPADARAAAEKNATPEDRAKSKSENEAEGKEKNKSARKDQSGSTSHEKASHQTKEAGARLQAGDHLEEKSQTEGSAQKSESRPNAAATDQQPDALHNDAKPSTEAGPISAAKETEKTAA